MRFIVAFLARSTARNALAFRLWILRPVAAIVEPAKRQAGLRALT
jgi:hypothetical protein